MAMTSMKMPKRKKSTLVSELDESPRYPYGLKINLEKEQLKQLGITDLPEVGSVVTLAAKCEVSSTSSFKTDNGERKDMSLQITEMSLKGDGGDEDIYS